MHSDDLISLIIPIYKVESYLDRCLESVVNQTYGNLEIILVDDGSPDYSGALADVWSEKDGRVRVIHKSNGGVSSARNLGLQTAEGKYVCLVDSDDYLDPLFVETLYSLLVNNKADIAAIGWQEVSETVPPVHDIFDSSYTEVLDRHEAIRGLFTTGKYHDYAWNKLYSKKLFSSVQYPEGRAYEDIGTTYLLLDSCERIAYNPARLYFYYQRADSIITRKDSKANRDIYLMRKQRYLYLKDNYPNIEIIFRDFFSYGLLLFLYQEKSEQQWLRAELTELWPRVRESATDKDRLKYFFCTYMNGLYCGLCRAKKRIIG